MLSVDQSLTETVPWKVEAVGSWYAAYTSPCHEKQVAAHLAVREVEHFLPLYTSVRRWASGRIVSCQCPLFPSYVFVRMERDDRGKVLSTPGIVSLVGTSREATALPRGEIEALRKGLHLYSAMPHPFLNVGEKARIRSGALAGMEGIVLRHRNRARIVISLAGIMKSISVEVDAADLEAVVFRIPNLAEPAHPIRQH